MINRENDIFDRFHKAKGELLGLKSNQSFGKDVTQPKIIQRMNSDGTPTDWDLIGYTNNQVPGSVSYSFNCQIRFRAKNQRFPWGAVYMKVMMNPYGEIYVPDAGGASSFPDIENMRVERTLYFNCWGSASPDYGPPSDPTVDRIWVKFYMLATDYGVIDIGLPAEGNGGTIVPLT